MDDALLGGKVVEWPCIYKANQARTGHALDERVVREHVDRDPVAVLAPAVLRVRLHGGCDVRRQRPRRRRPDDERLALTLAEREADEERRVLHLDVVLLARLLVLRERGAAARAPLGRAVPLVQPAAAVDLLQEAPDVLDVRVAERVVVVVPVHPHPEPLRLLGLHLGEAGHALLAPLGELGEPVLLDLALRIEPELLLDLDLDPEALAVEAVLVTLVVAAERLVALERVLQATAEVMDGSRPVRGDRPVHEAERRAAAVPVAEAFEGLLVLPECEDVALQRGMIGDRRKRREDLRHAFDSREREQRLRPPRFTPGTPRKEP